MPQITIVILQYRPDAAALRRTLASLAMQDTRDFAVVLGDDCARVWTVDGGNRAHSVPVEVGKTWNGATLVKSGLSEGDRIVCSGAFKLKEGAAVVCREGNEAR